MGVKRLVPLGILISGRGSNMEALIIAQREGRLSADIRVVISNKADAKGLEKASSYGIETLVISHKDYQTREDFDLALADALETRGVEYVALAGFMRVLTKVFLSRFPMRVLNIHPALLPSFKGVHAQRQALEYGAKVTGCTVHFVDEGVDSGPIIAQVPVFVRDDDTEETLSARILEYEHKVYPLALEAVLTGKIRIEGRRVLGFSLEGLF